MGHHIQAFVCNDSVVKAFVSRMPVAQAVPLSQGLLLILNTDKLYDTARERCPSITNADDETFWKFSGHLWSLVLDVSRSGPVAYIETDYFGGMGTQSAAVWLNEKELLAPQKESRAINAALRLLGAIAESGKDEFDTIGLSRNRSNEAWLETLKNYQ